MRGVNRVTILGNVGKDPEVKYLPSGACVVSFSVATSESWKDKNTGQQQERTEWHKCSAFNRLAEIVRDYVKSGSKLYLEGSLRTRSWEQDNITRYSTEIVVSEMQLLDSRNGGPAAAQTDEPRQRQSASPSQQPRSPASQPQNNLADDFGFSDDLPFMTYMKGYEHLV
jgi:single-strand DNA-binding protein